MNIIFNGVSSDSLGIEIYKHNPPASTQVEYETIQIPGRPEALYSAKATRRNFIMTFQGNVLEQGRLREIYAAYQGHGKLISSVEPDKYYKATARIITPERIILDYHKIDLEFDCQPYAYAVNNEPETITHSNAAVEVGGTEYCQPIYKVYGAGDIILKVNNVSVTEALTLYNVDEYATVDCEALMCHKDGELVRNRGKLPFLAVGTNTISWSGNVSRIEITKNERWI